MHLARDMVTSKLTGYSQLLLVGRTTYAGDVKSVRLSSDEKPVDDFFHQMRVDVSRLSPTNVFSPERRTDVNQTYSIGQCISVISNVL